MSARPAYGLGAVDVPTPMPVRGKPQPPIWPLVTGNNGGYLAVRSSPAQGACGVSGYPCKHPGVDVNGPPGKVVVSPTNGTVVFTADGASSPVSGYGPWVVIIKGDDGWYHLIGHLAAATKSMAPVGARVTAGLPIGTVSTAYHVHWEVRVKAIPDFARGESNATNNRDPLTWLSSSSGSWAPVLLLGAAAALVYLLTED